MLEKAKAFFVKTGKKGKAMLCTAIAAVSMLAMTVAASAAETPETAAAPDMATIMKDAGDQLGNSFNTLIQTMIPVILGIMGTAIVIYGILALIKLGKKIFGHVAG